MFSGATNQAARRGISLVVPLTLAVGQGSTPGGGGPRSPAEARQANPYSAEQRLTVVLPPRSSAADDAFSSSVAAASSPCVSHEGVGGEGAPCYRQPLSPGQEAGVCSTSSRDNSNDDGSQALVVPRATTDAVTRVIFQGIRGRTAAAAVAVGEAGQRGQRQESAEGEVVEDRLGALERLVAAAAGDAEVQASVARRIGGSNGAAFQPFLSPAAGAYHAYRPTPSMGSHLPPPLAPSPFTRPALPAPAPAAALPHRQQSRNFEAAVSCSICLLPLYEAHVLDCGGGHVFCKTCVDQLMSPATSGGFGGLRVPSVTRFFSILNTPLPPAVATTGEAEEDEEEEGQGGASGWSSLFSWVGTLFGQGREQQRRRRRSRAAHPTPTGLGTVERRCPECRTRFTTSIPVRRIGDIMDSVRAILPDALDAEDLAEQERRARECAASASLPGRRRKGRPRVDEPLPSAGAMDLDVPAWVMTLVALVVVVAMAVGRP